MNIFANAALKHLEQGVLWWSSGVRSAASCWRTTIHKNQKKIKKENKPPERGHRPRIVQQWTRELVRWRTQQWAMPPHAIPNECDALLQIMYTFSVLLKNNAVILGAHLYDLMSSRIEDWRSNVEVRRLRWRFMAKIVSLTFNRHECESFCRRLVAQWKIFNILRFLKIKTQILCVNIKRLCQWQCFFVQIQFNFRFTWFFKYS